MTQRNMDYPQRTFT